MIRRLLLLVAVVALAGCGESARKTPVELSDVPEAALKTVREKMPPDTTLTDAWKKADGSYEVRGRMKSGKIREVEVKADGTFIEME